MSFMRIIEIDPLRRDAKDQVLLLLPMGAIALGIRDAGFSGKLELMALVPEETEVTEARRFEIVLEETPLSPSTCSHTFIGYTDAYFVFEVIANRPEG